MSDLVFFIKQAMDAPLELTFELDPNQAADRVGDLLLADPPARIGGQFQIEKIQGSILVEGTVQGYLYTTCSRCLEKAKIIIDSPIRLILMPTPQFSHGELELGQDDLDTVYYTGEQVDLAPHLWDQIIVSIPQAPICSQDCKGLAVQLPHVSVGDSSCESRFAVLKTLSLKQPEDGTPAAKP
ncbi:DUF177 domain-containing protein [Myxococcota bacterium]|nr:DUF177 domain-containing protein [Myxococcota bacterium]